MDALRYLTGFGNEHLHRGASRARSPRGSNTPQQPPARASTPSSTAGRPSPSRAHATGGPGPTGSGRRRRTRRSPADRRRHAGAPRRSTARAAAQPAALGPAARPTVPTGTSSTRCGPTPATATRASTGRQPCTATARRRHDRPVLRRRRRRAAGRPAGRAAAAAHRATGCSTSAPARSRWCRAAAGSGSSCPTAGRRRVRVRELRRHLRAARARPDRRNGLADARDFRAPWPPARTARTGAAGAEVRRPAVGDRARPLPARRRRLARLRWCPTSTTPPASWCSARSASTTRTRRSSPS